jgi:hypothetical protein
MARYQLTNDAKLVFDTDYQAYVPVEGNWQSDTYQGWLAEGNTPDPAPGPTFADYYTKFLAMFSAWVEEVAGQNGYDSSLSCRAYKDSGVKQFFDDATSFSAWIDALWVWAADWENGMNGQIPSEIPSWPEIKAMAPQPEDFGWVVHPKGVIIAAVASSQDA